MMLHRIRHRRLTSKYSNDSYADPAQAELRQLSEFSISFQLPLLSKAVETISDCVSGEVRSRRLRHHGAAVCSRRSKCLASALESVVHLCFSLVSILPTVLDHSRMKARLLVQNRGTVLGRHGLKQGFLKALLSLGLGAG